LSNTELRVQAFRFPLLGEPVRVGGLVLFDMGRVWHPGTDNGPWHRVHPGLGAGVRLARRAAVLRLDYALATETWRQGIYVSFGHMF
jgi:outer membrane protein assembly factor BamA